MLNSSCVSHLCVVASFFSVLPKVLSRSASGRHCRSASRALRGSTSAHGGAGRESGRWCGGGRQGGHRARFTAWAVASREAARPYPLPRTPCPAAAYVPPVVRDPKVAADNVLHQPRRRVLLVLRLGLGPRRELMSSASACGPVRAASRQVRGGICETVSVRHQRPVLFRAREAEDD